MTVVLWRTLCIVWVGCPVTPNRQGEEESLSGIWLVDGPAWSAVLQDLLQSYRVCLKVFDMHIR